MSNQSNAGGGVGGRCSDRQPLAKRLDNSNFAQTCSLLSQFLKERRNLVDLRSDRVSMIKPRDDLEKPNLPPSTANPGNFSDDSRQRKDDLPKLVGFPPSGFSINATNKGEFRRPATPEPATAQMTIFYAGKVLVYNDFPNERAKEIMALADKGSHRAAAAAAPPATVVPSTPNRFAVGNPTGNSPAVEPNVVAKSQAPVATQPAVDQQLAPQPAAKKSSDLPIARRASLHRFLEKRKDRAVAVAPYPVNQQPEAAFKASGSSSANQPELELEPQPEPQPQPQPEPEPEPEPEEDFPLLLDLNL